MAPSTQLPGSIFFYLITVALLAFFAYSAYVRVRLIFLGKPDLRLNHILERVVSFFPLVLTQARVARPRFAYSGFLHLAIFWGFMTFQLNTINFFLEGISDDLGVMAWASAPWLAYFPVMQTFEILTVVGVTMALGRREIYKPPRLTLNWDARIILGFIGLLMLTDLFAVAFQIALEPFDHSGRAFFSNAVANAVDGWDTGVLEAWHTGFWYAHLLVFLLFLNALPYSKHMHIFTSAINVFFRRIQPTGVLQPIPDIETRDVFGLNMPFAEAYRLRGAPSPPGV